MSKLEAEVLRRASQILDEKGHCTGDWSLPSGEVCAKAALHEALGERGEVLRMLGMNGWMQTMNNIMSAVYDHLPMEDIRVALGREPHAFYGSLGPDSVMDYLVWYNDLQLGNKTDIQKIFLQTADEIEVQ